MLARDTYPLAYIDECRTRVQAQQSLYRKLVRAVASQAGGKSTDVKAALAALESAFFNNQLLLLDYYFVHRTPLVERQDGNPLNEVRAMATSLLEKNGVMSRNDAFTLHPTKTVLGYRVGQKIVLTEAQFEIMADAFFAEMRNKFGA
jgi:hypothetical protein